MKSVPGTLQEGGAPFQTTHWTLVLQARQIGSTESAQQALTAFCEAYWPPLYAFLRHRRRLNAHLLWQNYGGFQSWPANEWRSMILFGLYSGQRLGDVATIRWNK
jgi:integrase